VVALLGAVVLALALSACARKDHVTSADAGNLYVNAGPLTYQVQVTRALNPFSTEDAQYLAGIPNAQKIPANQLWFGVFLWAKNQSKRSAQTADTFKLVDSNGDVFTPVALNASVNPYAWTRQTLNHDAIEPMADSTASSGSTGGGLILFKLDQNVYSNRPLTLEVFAPGSAKPSKVSLDL
jgi:hypothetical protein